MFDMTGRLVIGGRNISPEFRVLPDWNSTGLVAVISLVVSPGPVNRQFPERQCSIVLVILCPRENGCVVESSAENLDPAVG